MHRSVCSIRATNARHALIADSVQNDTSSLQGKTNMVTMRGAKRQMLTILVFCATVAHTNPLTQASEHAMRLCAAEGSASVEECAASSARSTGQKQAQKAALAFYKALAAENESCTKSAVECELSATMLVEIGFAAAFQEPQTRSLPRSDMRR